jgi:hypothetical protein
MKEISKSQEIHERHETHETHLSTPALVSTSLTPNPLKSLLVEDVITLDKVWLADDNIRQE